MCYSARIEVRPAEGATASLQSISCAGAGQERAPSLPHTYLRCNTTSSPRRAALAFGLLARHPTQRLPACSHHALIPAALSAAGKWEQLIARRARWIPQSVCVSAPASCETEPLNCSRLNAGAGKAAPEGLLLQEASEGERLHEGFSPISLSSLRRKQAGETEASCSAASATSPFPPLLPAPANWRANMSTARSGGKFSTLALFGHLPALDAH